jgi:hypothetical protein
MNIELTRTVLADLREQFSIGTSVAQGSAMPPSVFIDVSEQDVDLLVRILNSGMSNLTEGDREARDSESGGREPSLFD